MSRVESLIKYESSKGICINTVSETKPKMILSTDILLASEKFQ